MICDNYKIVSLSNCICIKLLFVTISYTCQMSQQISQSINLKVSNIKFNINKFKNKMHIRRSSLPSASFTKSVLVQPQKQISQNIIENGAVTLLRNNSFIPKACNIKNSCFLMEKSPKKILSLQSAELNGKKFPMRKILTRRVNSGHIFFKQKRFSFQNPQTQAVFENKHIIQLLSKSQMDFKSSSRISSSNTKSYAQTQMMSRSQIYTTKQANHKQKINMRYAQVDRFRYNQNKNRQQQLLMIKLDFK